MRDYQINASQEQSAIQLKPIISYPRVAEAGETYLLTIDVRLADGSPWPYQEEEFEISFILETAPFFTHEPLGEHEPGIVLHRFGGTYGAAEYVLTTSKKEMAAGYIKIAFINGWGLPVAQLQLECEVQQNVSKPVKEPLVLRKRTQPPVPGPAPFTASPPRFQGQENLSSEDDVVAYDVIETRLAQTGWDVQMAVPNIIEGQWARYSMFRNVSVPLGKVAIKGYSSFENDYLLFIDQRLAGVVKVYTQSAYFTHISEPISLSAILERTIPGQSDTREERALSNVPFIYVTTGYMTEFKNYLEPQIPSREVYTFHQPATLALWLEQTTSKTSFRALLHAMPSLTQGDLYDHQFAALQQIERSLSEYRPRILIKMETSTGKTYTSINSTYRLLAYANAQHILYITEAREYTLEEFQNFTLPGDTRKFTDRYTVRLIDDKAPEPSVHVYIGTIEEIYSLYATGRAGQLSTAPEDTTGPLDAVRYLGDYTPDLPIEYFDVVFLPQCEHVNYAIWRNALNYLDTFFIGVADEISDDVLQFFRNNLVYPTKETNIILQDKQSLASLPLSQRQLSAIIKSVRSSLRKDVGLSGETDRLSQLVWLLFLKYLDDFELSQAELLGNDYIPIIEKNYRWRDWVVAESLNARRKGEKLLMFVNDDLIPYLGRLSGEDNRDIRTIIGTVFSGIYNRIRSGYILREVVDKLDIINFHSSDDLRAILPFYEATLKEMHDSAGDKGDFYTPRPVVRFIIDRLQPRLGESVLDPACGTAGFLVEAYEHLKKQVHAPEQHRQLENDLIGIEKESLPYLLAIMNMLLHGIETPNIIRYNALIMDFLQDRTYVDIVATNPPFGKEEDHSVINKFSIRGTATALIFVQYIMKMLKWPGGRCGIILPDSFLFVNRNTREIKHHLLTHFNLHTIVRLTAGVLSPYTAIPTNILFFEADDGRYHLEQGSYTKEIWYYEIPPPEGRKSFTKTKPVRDEDFQACLAWWDYREENEHAWKVSIEQILKDDYNLDYKNPHRQNNNS